MKLSREELIEWHIARRELYKSKGFTEDDAMLLAVLDAIEETKLPAEDMDDDE